MFFILEKNMISWYTFTSFYWIPAFAGMTIYSVFCILNTVFLIMQDKTKFRLLEMVPASILWSTFILAIVLSFIKPLWVIFFIIVFDLFWVYRVTYFVFYMGFAWTRYRKSIKTDWLKKLEDIPGRDKILHTIFLPTYNESIDVLKATLDSLLSTDYPADKMIVILGFEERAGMDEVNKKKAFFEKNYSEKFYKLLLTVHPDNLEGEIKAKGANANWMGHRVQEYIDEHNIKYEDVIVSYFDCDTRVHKKYFSALTYMYLTHPTPTRTSFQPVALYNNNIWESPVAMRVTAFATVFWLMTELMRPERLYTFSSHSMSFKALVDVGFWQKDIVTDDSRIFLQCFMHYNGDYAVTPMYVPVSMYTVLSDKTWESYKALYKQMRRWAWGVEHFPYMVWNFRKRKGRISFFKKFRYLFNITEGMYSWASAPILIFILGRLPLWVENTYYFEASEAKSFFVQNAPFILEKLMIIAMIGIFVSALFSLLLLPKRPSKYPFTKSIVMFLQWILLPITLILFGSLPAIEAQTRLFLGKYLGFFVSPKSGKS